MNKKIVVIVSLICLVTIIILLLLIDHKKENLNNIIEEQDIKIISNKIEVYSNIKLSDIIELKGYALVNDYKIDTDELGTKELEFEYINYEETKKEKITINIVDTTKPFISLGDHYNHLVGTNFTFYDDVLCADNYDRNIKCEIIGDYDTSIVGDTNLKVIAKDKSGNIEEKEFVLKVVEKPIEAAYTKPIDIKDAINNKPENAKLMIDVSKWQKDIDWKKVKEAGIDYAMLRLGTQKALDQESILDEYFEKNIKEAQENGIKVGIYYFSYANDTNDAIEQANWVIEQLNDYKIELPISFDWECWKYYKDLNINIHDLNEIGKTFLDTIKANGYDIINYGSKNYLVNIWDIDQYDVWLAHYTTKTNYEKEYLMWQFTDRGLVPGINGYVDLDYYYGS